MELFSSMYFIVVVLVNTSFIHFEFIPVNGVRKWANFIHKMWPSTSLTPTFTCGCPVGEWYAFPHNMVLAPLSWIKCWYICAFVSERSIQLHWSMCLFSFPHHIVSITVALLHKVSVLPILKDSKQRHKNRCALIQNSSIFVLSSLNPLKITYSYWGPVPGPPANPLHSSGADFRLTSSNRASLYCTLQILHFLEEPQNSNTDGSFMC